MRRRFLKLRSLPEMLVAHFGDSEGMRCFDFLPQNLCVDGRAQHVHESCLLVRQHLKTKVYFCSEKARIINTIIHGLQCFCLSFSDDVSCSNNPPTCFVCEMGGHSRRSLRMSWCLQQKVSGSRGWQRAVLEADLQSSPFSPFFVENNPL